MADEILTLKEISKYLRISPDTVYKMAQESRIPSFKVGKKWRFKKDRIDKWLLQQEKENRKITRKKKR